MSRYARTDDPETSHEAAETIRAVSHLQADLLRLFRQFGSMTDEQLMARHGAAGMVTRTPERIRTARCELVRGGRLVWSGDYGTTARGNRARLWRLPEPVTLF